MKNTYVFAMLVLLTATAFADGAAIFKSKCAVCHGPDGKGQTPVGKALKARNLGSAEVQKQADAALSKTVAEGKEKMPAYKSSLTADNIKQVVAHIRTFKK